MDSTIVTDVNTLSSLVYTAVSAVVAVVGFIAGRIHALRKKR
jgi:hypothetical protein